jgi:hypothetical protein
MNAITGTWKNGQIVLDNPVSWPDACRVLIEPVSECQTIGMREEDWQDTPEAIADWIRWYDSLEPLILTPEEQAEWDAVRKAQKEFEKSKFEERAKRVEGYFS